MDKNFVKLNERIEKVKEIKDWSEKYKEIERLKEKINSRRIMLKDLVMKLNSLEDENYSIENFDKFDLDMIIDKIENGNTIEKQVKNLIILKSWYDKERKEVIDDEGSEKE